MSGPNITINRIRTAVDSVLSRVTPLTDVLTSTEIRIWQAEDVQIELGIFNNGTIAADITNFASVTMEVKSPDDLLAAPLISKTVLAAAFDLSVSLAHWNDQSEQHAIFTLSNSETNVELAGKKSRELTIFFCATTTDLTPKRIPLGSSPMTLQDSGYGDLSAILVLPAGARIKSNKLQIYNQDDTKYYDLVLRTVSGQPSLSVEGAGET